MPLRQPRSVRSDACHGLGPDVRENPRPVFRRHGDRPRHRQHPGLCQGPRDRPERTLGGGDFHQPRQATGPRRRRGGQADGRPHARQHRGHPPVARRRDRRLRSLRRDDQALHPPRAPAPRLCQPTDGDLRPLRIDGGRAARHPGKRRERRCAARVPDRGADGGGARRRPAGDRAHRLDGGRYRRRHHRGRDPVARRDRLRQVDPQSAATRWTRPSSTTSGATTAC